MKGVVLDDISPCARPATPGHVLHDNLDDRREVFRLLARLPPARRVAWLEWACRKAVLPGSQVHPVVSSRTRQLAERARWDTAADERLTLEVFYDLWHLDVSFRVDFEALLRGLEKAGRG